MSSFSGNDWNGDGNIDFLDDLFDMHLIESGLKDQGRGSRRSGNGGGCGSGLWLLIIIGIISAAYSYELEVSERSSYNYLESITICV